MLLAVVSTVLLFRPHAAAAAAAAAPAAAPAAAAVPAAATAEGCMCYCVAQTSISGSSVALRVGEGRGFCRFDAELRRQVSI